MAAQDWLVLKKIGLHTLNSGSAILSFVVLAYLTKQGIEDGLLRTILGGIEGGVLTVLILVFACHVIYDVLPEKMQEVTDLLSEKIREIIASKFVFA